MLGDASGCGEAVSLVNEARGGLVSPESSPEHHRRQGSRGEIVAAWRRVEEGRLGETEEGRLAL